MPHALSRAVSAVAANSLLTTNRARHSNPPALRLGLGHYDRRRPMRSASFAGICVNNEPVKTRGDDFILAREQENCRRATRPSVPDAVEIWRNLQCHWTRQEP